MLELRGSVGKDGLNASGDVRVVQTLLVQIGLRPGLVNGTCGTVTIATIQKFQGAFSTVPDGRIDPGGRTWKKLLESAAPAAGDPLSGWAGDCSQWTQQKKLRSLEPVFRAKIEQVILDLKNRKLQPSIVFGWRSVETQRKLFSEKKTTVLFSFHNAQFRDGTPNALAADIIDRRWAWTEAAHVNGFWNALGAAGKEQGLVWGGDWKAFPDIAHLQGRPNRALAKVRIESGL